MRRVPCATRQTLDHFFVCGATWFSPFSQVLRLSALCTHAAHMSYCCYYYYCCVRTQAHPPKESSSRCNVLPVTPNLTTPRHVFRVGTVVKNEAHHDGTLPTADITLQVRLESRCLTQQHYCLVADPSSAIACCVYRVPSGAKILSATKNSCDHVLGTHTLMSTHTYLQQTPRKQYTLNARRANSRLPQPTA